MRIPARGTGYDLSTPVDLAFDVFEHLYVLERTQVLIFGADGKLLATFTPDPASGFRRARRWRSIPRAGLYIYDEATGRVVIYQ